MQISIRILYYERRKYIVSVTVRSLEENIRTGKLEWRFELYSYMFVQESFRLEN
jgi:hypothetical protein